MKVLVTGATGFLGSDVVRVAAEQGLDITATGRSQAPPHAKAHFVQGDLRAPGWLEPLMRQHGAVIHAAGLAHAPLARAEAFHEANVEATRRVMRAAAEAGVSRVVLVSSVSVYGSGPGSEHAECRPAGPYAASKHASEQAAEAIAADAGIALIVLRMATIYGEGDRGNVARLVRALDRGRFVWIGRGDNRKSLVYREDAARACVDAATRPGLPPGRYNISAPPVGMREVVDGICAALDRPRPSLRIPGRAALAAARAADLLARPLGSSPMLAATVSKWLSDEHFDAGRFRAAAGWEPRVAIADGLARETAWYRAHRGSTRL
jgi:nucleoside-diphosphate-sugar epimerase